MLPHLAPPTNIKSGFVLPETKRNLGSNIASGESLFIVLSRADKRVDQAARNQK